MNAPAPPSLQASDQQIWSQVFASPPLCSSCCLCARRCRGPIPSSRLGSEGRRARGLSPSDPSRLAFFLTALTAPLLQFLSFVSVVLFASFRRAETSAGLFGKNKGGVVVKGFTRAVQLTPTWMPPSHALTRTFRCFLWPKQLVFVVKRLIREKTPHCCRS